MQLPMKKIFYSILTLLVTGLSACDDFMQREPMDFTDDKAYFHTANDLMIYVNTFYTLLPGMNSGGWGGVYADDNNSDNQAGPSANPLFYKGDKYTPLVRDSHWKFDNIRNLNYFILKITEKQAEESIAGTSEYIQHYLGEAYFFKAWEYFRLLSNLGDVPILEDVPSENYNELVALSRRAPRNEVARYILQLLDTSAGMLMPSIPQSGRITRDAALLLKARVALFEATWLKYHQGTAFTPGNAKWPGASTYPDFKFAGGTIVSEYNYFFDQAITAADSVASRRPLYADYPSLFNDVKGTVVGSPEVILARYYLQGINGHSASHYLYRTGAGTGFTRSMVESFLNTNGLPIYADASYKGDTAMYDMLQNRDYRLTSSVKPGGLRVVGADTVLNYKPQIWSAGNQGTPTGYEVRKWISTETGQEANPTAGTSATPVLRSAEAYLIYLEAWYERHGNLNSKCDGYWRALRRRAKINEEYTATIAATVLSSENDLATHSRSTLIDATLYNIRRERRNEFIAEGMRLMDLRRWRALDHMANYQTEGFNLWASVYKLYSSDQISVGQTVSSPTLSTYLRPYQKQASSIVYDGYTFPKQHYLEPLPVSELVMTSINGQPSTIYQNPGWPAKIAGPADYAFDCD